jgi:Flp pilus assembly protein TadB
MPANAPMFLIVPGAGMILFGLLLVYNPDLLVYLVAGIFFLLGFLLLMAGLRARRLLG